MMLELCPFAFRRASTCPVMSKLGIVCSAEVGEWAQCLCPALCAVTLPIIASRFFLFSSFSVHFISFMVVFDAPLDHELCFALKVSELDSMFM